ncbi:holo-ACP synthase [Aureibacillus halotolerans]|uniref:Holo-[acyl-carrier-protein] synthase n=1 Tax=Aureibacillus halotolerans TaxID=1508390 RepID=A0A4R6TVN0_9BACI|nr:holo-ACP synthase [Aureibacillus halotolerans]TDQ36732.1 holo-[acyl-carrier protein] synthase [Aureibacillus halotolerans]
MIQGIGLDIVSIQRIEDVMSRQSGFIDRVLTDREKAEYMQLQGRRKSEYVAGRFAAKEAFSKAIGTGIGRDCGFLDVEILRSERGAPVLYTTKTPHAVHVSISHSESSAVAQVILEER